MPDHVHTRLYCHVLVLWWQTLISFALGLSLGMVTAGSTGLRLLQPGTELGIQGLRGGCTMLKLASVGTSLLALVV